MEESRKVYGWLVRDRNAAVGCSSMWTGTRGGENYCGNLLWQSGLTLLPPGSRYYEPGKCPLDVLPQILMFGVENDVHIDIPRGSVRGMVNDKTSSTGKSLGQGAVGRNTMLVYPPHTK